MGMLGPLGDNIGKVEYLTHMGDDLMVVNAARVSMAKESDWEIDEIIDVGFPGYRERVLSDKDKKLISYLAKHGHWTPFSQPQIQLRIKMPIFVARQWYKHQIGFTRNEVSRRYVDTTPELHSPYQWRKRAENVKQGSSSEVSEYNSNLIESTHKLNKQLLRHYNDLINLGVCPEQARMVLPQSMYTEFVETGSLAAYARLCQLRLDKHAQVEVQLYAENVAKIIKSLYPVSWKALTERTTND